jgi:hypothetical protein
VAHKKIPSNFLSFFPKAAAEAAETNNKLLQTGQTAQVEPETHSKKRKETQANENNNILPNSSKPTKSILRQRHTAKVKNIFYLLYIFIINFYTKN